MKTLGLSVACATLAASLWISPAEAQLIDRGNGCIYDADRDITWIQSANTAVDTGYDSDGLMTKTDADDYVDWFNNVYNWPVGDNWRLPITFAAPDPSCSDSFNEGFGCTQSEMGHLYYIELGNTAGEGGLTNRGDFIDIQTDLNYWSEWDWTSPGSPPESITFKFRTGLQTRSAHTESHYVWLVHDGDVAPQTQCNDGVDNDSDGKIDSDDPGCEDPGDDDEYNFELAIDRYTLKYIPLNYALRGLYLEGMPWCPMGFPGCPGNRFSIEVREQAVPSHLLELKKAMWKMVQPSADAASFNKTLQELQDVIEKVPDGRFFDVDEKGRFLQAINAGRSGKRRSPTDFLFSPVLVQSLNAIELDWRLPSLETQRVKAGKTIGIDMKGALWAGLTDVRESGELTLSIIDGYEAFPVDSQYSPTWPYLSYVVKFNGNLGPEGYMDLGFYLKQLRFDPNVSSIRVLRIDEDRLVDVTTGIVMSRGIVMARTNRSGTFIIVGRQ